MPDEKEIPDKIGFDEIDKYPQNIIARFF